MGGIIRGGSPRPPPPLFLRLCEHLVNIEIEGKCGGGGGAKGMLPLPPPSQIILRLSEHLVNINRKGEKSHGKVDCFSSCSLMSYQTIL